MMDFFARKISCFRKSRLGRCSGNQNGFVAKLTLQRAFDRQYQKEWQFFCEGIIFIKSGSNDHVGSK